MEARQDWIQETFWKQYSQSLLKNSRQDVSLLAKGVGFVHQRRHQTGVASAPSQWREKPGGRKNRGPFSCSSSSQTSCPHESEPRNSEKMHTLGRLGGADG